MANGFVTAGGGTNKIIIRAKGITGVLVQATLDGKTYSGTVGAAGFVDIPVKKTGTYSIKISSGTYSKTYPLNVYQYGITECVAAKSFKDCTAGEIQMVCGMGDVRNLWEIGDEKEIQLIDGENIVVQIVDFYHDAAQDGTKLPLTLGMKDCLNTRYRINTSATNAGGWETCNFRTVELPKIEERFPAEWRGVMKPCQKLTGAGNNSANLRETYDKLFLPSEIELVGASGYDATTNKYGAAGEGTTYPIFINDASRIKKVNNVESAYWTRTPKMGSTVTSRFTTISASGGYTSSESLNAANVLNGIPLFFCVG